MNNETEFVPVVDVAYYQGAIDFAKLKASGVEGVIARASDGWRKGLDPKWIEYATGAAAAGLPLGSYWYQRPLDGNEGPVDQARRWVQYVDDAEKLGADVRFLMLDLEWYWSPEYPGALPAHENAAWTRAHIAELRRIQTRPVIAYTSGNYWNAYLADDRLAADLPFILARYHYGNTQPPTDPTDWARWALANPKRPTVPRNSGPWEGWQISSSLFGPAVGIEATRVDACIVRRGAWNEWIGSVAVEPPVVVPPPPAVEPIAPVVPPSPSPLLPDPSEVVTVNVTLPKLSTRSTSAQALHVKKYQAQINAVTGRGIAVDGKFGPQTEKATEDFQRFFGLVVDGWVGEQTWTTLLAVK